MQAAPVVIDHPVPVYQAVDSKLTNPLPAPAPPPWNCLFKGEPTVCVLDALMQIPAWSAVRDAANLDRATTAKSAPAKP